jgi:hypothetical protein
MDFSLSWGCFVKKSRGEVRSSFVHHSLTTYVGSDKVLSKMGLLSGGCDVNSKKPIYFLFFLLGLCLVFSACKKEMTDEEIIFTIIADAAESAREKDIKGVLEHVSLSYKDEEGNDRDGMKGLLFYYFRSYERVGIFVRDVEISVEGDRADASVKVIFTGGEDIDEVGDVIPSSGSGYLLDLKLRREDDTWMVIRAGWTDIGFVEAL